MWYSGNIKIFSEDLEKRTFDNWARKLSERLSKSGTVTEKRVDNGQKSMKLRDGGTREWSLRAKRRRAAERENRGAADPEELGDSGERVL